MSLLTTAEHRRQRLLCRLLFGTVAVLVVVATTVAVTLLVVERATAPTTGDVAIDPPAQSASGESGAAAEPEVGIWRTPPVSAGPLILPRPTGSNQGIPVGFPHTTEGAISAAAHYAEVSVGLDVGTARALGEVAGAPSYLDAAEHFVQATRIARSRLGVSEHGDPRGVYLTFQAQAYRVSDAKLNQVTLAISGRVDGAGPATSGRGQGGVTATSYTLVWVDGDWHLAGDGDSVMGPIPEPRSPHAYREGWRDLALA